MIDGYKNVPFANFLDARLQLIALEENDEHDFVHLVALQILKLRKIC